MRLIDTSNLRGDLFGGITAGIVALPLALALGVASGMGAIAGLYGAIFVGFFAALFGGTPSQISGPTGPMVVVMAGVVASLPGRPELVLTAVVLAGLFQIAFGLMRFGEYIRLVPYPVISGFMSGIGAIIIILQVGRLIGGEPPGDTISALIYMPHALSEIDFSAVAVGALTLAVVFYWPKELGRYVPAPLAALILATLAGLALRAPVLGDIPSGLPSLHLPVFDRDATLLVFEAGLILAVLGSIDSLLTSLVADNVTRTRHESNRELIGQGIGNTVAGLFGGIAGAGATMRTLVNIRTGGRTRLSGMVHALLLLAIVLGLGPLAAQVPHAALAGILVKVGWDIIDWSYLKNAHRGPRWDLLLMALVLCLTVFVDLITAVAVGVVLGSIAYVRQVAQAQIKAILDMPPALDSDEEAALLERAQGRVHIFDLGGPLSFGAAADLGHHVRERSRKNQTEVLILDFARVPFIDVSAARAVETIACDAKQMGRTVYCTGIRDEVRNVLTGLDADCCIDADRLFDRRIDALRAAVAQIESSREPEAVPHGAPAIG
jgi:SulP family sulfate permease